MSDWDYSLPQYHGSPLPLETITKGSWITQSRRLARAFSHKPTAIASGDGDTFHHKGMLHGYLYRVAEEIGPADVTLLSDTDRTHWSLNREMRVELLEEVPLVPEEMLTETEAVRLRDEVPRRLGRDTGYLSDTGTDPPLRAAPVPEILPPLRRRLPDWPAITVALLSVVTLIVEQSLAKR